jgi:hypothetical protein
MAAGNIDHPFYEVAAQAQVMMALGHTIHQKFTCARCGSRQTMAMPNVFYQLGQCEECGHETDIVAQGCNYVAMAGVLTPH